MFLTPSLFIRSTNSGVYIVHHHGPKDEPSGFRCMSTLDFWKSRHTGGLWDFMVFAQRPNLELTSEFVR